MMRLVVITDTPFAAAEPHAIEALLDGGIDRVHLRKPGVDEAAVRRLIESLPPSCYPRLSLHDRLPLAVEYGLGGVHLNSRNPLPPTGFTGLVSRSCHTLAELAAPAPHRTDYSFLSPLFDSISKQGYRAAFSPDALRRAAAAGIVGPHTVALGGVRPELLPQLRDWGFGGAALLGYVWRDITPSGLRATLEALHRYNP